MSDTELIGIREVVAQVVRETLAAEKTQRATGEAESPTPRYLTLLQAAVALVISLLTLIGMWVAYIQGVQAGFVSDRDRIARVEYQAAISIEDRKDLRIRVERAGDIEAQINNRLARIEALLGQMKH